MLVHDFAFQLLSYLGKDLVVKSGELIVNDKNYRNRMSENLILTATFALKVVLIVTKDVQGSGTSLLLKWILARLFVEVTPRF